MGLDRTTKRRLSAALLGSAVIAAGLAVHALLPDTAATDVAGDVLYAVAAYFAVVIVAPRLPPIAVASITAGWCIAVELFQLTGIPLALGAVVPASTLVLGTVFDTRDLFVYVITAFVMSGVDAASRVLLARRRGAHATDSRMPEAPTGSVD